MATANEWDVIVAGAGPSGAAAAIELAQLGRHVLLVDREEFPRDKICGDGVGVAVMSALYDLGLADEIAQAEQRGEFYPLDYLRLVSPNGYVVRAEFHDGAHGEKTYVAPRLYFDSLIQKQAIATGAEFMVADVKQPLVEDGQVVGILAQRNGSPEAFRARAVIGADGTTSAIMRHLRPQAQQHVDEHRAVALRAYIEDLEILPHELEFYLYDDILPGYAWVFPAGDNLANIGLGMRLDKFRGLKRNLKTMLRQFLDMPAIKVRLKRGGDMHSVAVWQLNFGSQENLQHTFDGALLIGDAAGFINPLTGGGIHNGLISAHLAAETIDEALRKGDTSRAGLSNYERRIEQELWRNMRKSFFYQRLLMNYPGIVDRLIRIAGQHSGIAKIFISKL